MNDDVQLVREIGEVKAELSGLKAEVAGTNQRLDDIVITQLKDHGKRLAALDVRIAALEAAENKRAGGLSVLAGVAAAAGSLPDREEGDFVCAPHMRGDAECGCGGVHVGNTPTCVGKIRPISTALRMRRKHLHMRRESAG